MFLTVVFEMYDLIGLLEHVLVLWCIACVRVRELRLRPKALRGMALWSCGLHRAGGQGVRVVVAGEAVALWPERL
jgi:hypothetical protein